MVGIASSTCLHAVWRIEYEIALQIVIPPMIALTYVGAVCGPPALGNNPRDQNPPDLRRQDKVANIFAS